jgi:3-deoxy-manno-octulosonate cytidylyltransferase (CMP-KDO synthetase)
LSQHLTTVGIIPARYASSRFEGKALVDILGKPMIQHVYERACQSKLLDRVVVATDDQRISDVVSGFGGEAILTGPAKTGTDRVAKVAESLSDDIVANIQGDEPLLDPKAVDQLLQPFLDDSTTQVTTLMQRIENPDDYYDPNVVKVVVTQSGQAMYFSRSCLPGNLGQEWSTSAPNFRHVGLYAFKRSCLMDFIHWKRTPYETSEGLEQLRFLENGVSIRVLETKSRSIGIDTPDDLKRLMQFLKA